MRTSSGVHPPLALFRVGPPIFPSANARAVVVVAVPFTDAACDRARAPACPRLFPVVPPRPRLFVAVAPFSSPPSLSPFATSRARTRDDTGRREDVRRPPRAMMTRALVARRPVARRPVETMISNLNVNAASTSAVGPGGTDSRVVIRGRVGGHRHPRRHRRQRRAL